MDLPVNRWRFWLMSLPERHLFKLKMKTFRAVWFLWPFYQDKFVWGFSYAFPFNFFKLFYDRYSPKLKKGRTWQKEDNLIVQTRWKVFILFNLSFQTFLHVFNTSLKNLTSSTNKKTFLWSTKFWELHQLNFLDLEQTQRHSKLNTV